jgi:predicted ABC-type ATPase
MEGQRPKVIIIGGPNGAGKTTISREVIGNTLGVAEFVNADAIAAGLSAFNPELAAFAAGRVMLARLQELADVRPPSSFAFESTLASRTFGPWLATLAKRGFEIHIVYVWLNSASLAVRRVASRVRRGGHTIPEDVIRRRFTRSAANFFGIYKPLAEASGSWRVYDNSKQLLTLVAHGGHGSTPIIVDAQTYLAFQATARNAASGPREHGD